MSKSEGTDAVFVDNLHKSFLVRKNPFQRAKRVEVLKGITLRVRKGSVLGLVGESGSGKTTLAKVIAGLEKPSSGSVAVEGKVQMVFQDPFSSLNPRMRVRDIVTEPVQALRRLSRSEKEDVAAGLLARVGLDPSDMHKYPHEFSGGQRQRIAIARAISTSPDVLLLDEPTSSLDVFVQAQIIDLLMDIHRRTGATYIFITHNIPLVVKIADRIAVMHEGKIVEEGEALEVFYSPKHPYTKRLIASVPSRILSLMAS